MQRILIIGNAGSGKTTFGKKLAEKLQIPLVHLDRLFWCGEWEHLSRNEFDALVQTELKKPAWIIDGNYNRTLPHRLKYCDTVFYFDLPSVTCLLGITKRLFTNYGKSREDMGGNCVERLDSRKFYLYRNVLRFNKEHRNDYLQLLSKAPNTRIVIFRKRRDADRFLAEL